MPCPKPWALIRRTSLWAHLAGQRSPAVTPPPPELVSPFAKNLNLNPTSIYTAHNQGKPQAIAMIRETCPYSNVIMIGDGITDLEAVQVRRDNYARGANIEKRRSPGVTLSYLPSPLPGSQAAPITPASNTTAVT